MSSRRRGSKDAVKVVIINTEYVETDARSFKSVVQNLTGKDSIISYASRAPVLSRGMSFNEFERMIKELPPFDEL
ncbi:PREDICTED: VQ motif-containing protein 1-like [Erythranthe guttata]|uniref:VQ motif-containing protein 1-like n=1 Tax=Erythranthe guttata TaxID=4155 RepID=UPI00064D8398|nr:PREDICTED: VQ motif-containing protein 1-like [Erythranthe guttata]|eukprot:XP_012850531.1 PREDICTED: VQ motif-containing protein 1-like [Erythranthe guttata]